MKLGATNPKIGDIHLVNFKGDGNEQHGIRPALVIQNNKGNKHSPNVIVLPITSSIKKVNSPTHVVLSSKRCGLKYDSMVLCENPNTISKNKIGKYLTTLDSCDMERVACANILATSAISFINPSKLYELRRVAVSYNDAA